MKPETDKSGALLKEKSENVKLVFFLALIMLLMLVIMSAFEFAKHLLDPDITIWESHVVTIVFSSLLVTSAAYFVLRYLSQRKRAEKALQESEKKFQVLAETLPAAIFLYQGEKYLYVNPMAETLTGYSRDELLTGDAWGWIQADFRDLVRDRARRRQRGEQLPTRYEVKYRSKDGREGWVDFTAGRVVYGGKPAGLAMAFDVSQRKLAEEALKASEQFLNNVFDSIQDGISILDKDLNIIRVNHVMEEWYRYMKPLVGKKCYYAYHEQQTPCGVCPSLRAIRLKTAQCDIVPYRGEGGALKRWLEIFSFPILDDEGNVTGVIEHVRDITERKQDEEELKVAKAQAELYLDLMGHDINNMHQIALGYLELVRDMPASAIRNEFLDKPIEVLLRSTQLIKNVRKLQKLSDGVFRTELVDVCKLLVDIQKEYGSVPHKSVSLDTNGCESCHVRANELLYDVFANLVGNAIKHTVDRANIVIVLDVVEDVSGRYCRIVVEDDGAGIPDDFKGVIFNRALKGATNAKGMGLGLYLVKSLVESYGGRVWVEDRVPGNHTKGAKFVVMLPAV